MIIPSRIKVTDTLDPTEPGEGGYMGQLDDMWVIVSDTHYDGELWRHASCSLVSKQGTIPDYTHLKKLYDLCMLHDRIAYQLFVPADQHVHVMPETEVLHLWQHHERDLTPDFRVMGLI